MTKSGIEWGTKEKAVEDGASPWPWYVLPHWEEHEPALRTGYGSQACSTTGDAC